ncbi:MAG: ribosome-recycling factor [Candidatus Shapirobacteria bacterium]|nr:ribosome-recycling factor [Candidatus Shapirobacteria bacterium]
MLEETKTKMVQALNLLREDVVSMRTSRANPALVENLQVSAYEGAGELKIKELASISVEGVNCLVIQPWDPKVAKNIAQTLEVSELGLSVAVGKDAVRATLPPLSAQRREEYVRLLKKKLEAARVMIRQIRAEERNQILHQKDAGEISQDDAFRQEEKLQELTDNQIEEIDRLGDKKIAELEVL